MCQVSKFQDSKYFGIGGQMCEILGLKIVFGNSAESFYEKVI